MPTEQEINEEIERGTKRGISGRGISGRGIGGIGGGLPLPNSTIQGTGLPLGGGGLPGVGLPPHVVNSFSNPTNENNDKEDNLFSNKDNTEEVKSEKENDFSDDEWGEVPIRSGFSENNTQEKEETNEEEKGQDNKSWVDEDDLGWDEEEESSSKKESTSFDEDDKDIYNEHTDNDNSNGETLVLIKNKFQRVACILLVLGLIFIGILVLKNIIVKLKETSGSDNGLNSTFWRLRGVETQDNNGKIAGTNIEDPTKEFDKILSENIGEENKEKIEENTNSDYKWDLSNREDLAYDKKFDTITYKGEITETLVGKIELCSYIKLDENTIDILCDSGFRTVIDLSNINVTPANKGEALIEVYYSMQQDEPVFLKFKNFK